MLRRYYFKIINNFRSFWCLNVLVIGNNINAGASFVGALLLNRVNKITSDSWWKFLIQRKSGDTCFYFPVIWLEFLFQPVSKMSFLFEITVFNKRKLSHRTCWSLQITRRSFEFFRELGFVKLVQRQNHNTLLTNSNRP